MKLKLIKRKMDIIQIFIFCIPFMFYLAGFNTSVSDLLIPIVFIWIILNKSKMNIKNNNYIHCSGKIWSLLKIYCITILIILCMGVFHVLLLNVTTMEIVSSIRDLIKIVICIIYVGIFSYLFKNYNEYFEDLFLNTWKYSSLVISIMCIAGVFLYINGINNNWTEAYRAKATFDDSNLAASYLLVSLGLVSILNYKESKNVIKMNSVLIIIAIVLTASRGAYIALVLSILYPIILCMAKKDITTLKKIIKIIMPFIIIISIIILLNPQVFEKAISRGSSSEKSLLEDGRFKIWIGGIYMWMTSPFIGIGVSRFYYNIYETVFSTGRRVLAHNTYITFLSEVGIIGLISFLWLPIIIIRKISIVIRDSKDISYFFLLFTVLSIYISAISINLQNFRVMWIVLAYSCYKIDKYNKNLNLGKENVGC